MQDWAAGIVSARAVHERSSCLTAGTVSVHLPTMARAGVHSLDGEADSYIFDSVSSVEIKVIQYTSGDFFLPPDTSVQRDPLVGLDDKRRNTGTIGGFFG